MRTVIAFAMALCGLGIWLAQSFDETAQKVAESRQAKPPQRAPVGRMSTIPRHPDGHFYITATIEGRPVKFMIDSGASHIMLTQQDAQRLGRFVRKKDLVHKFNTANGANYAAQVSFAQMRIGGHDFSKVKAFVIPEGLGISLLGQSVLSQFAVVEMKPKELVLRW